MKPVILDLLAIHRVVKHCQLTLGVRLVRSAGEMAIFETIVDNEAQVSLVPKEILSAQSLRRSSALVTLRVANGKTMLGALHEADISLSLSATRSCRAHISVTDTRSRGRST